MSFYSQWIKSPKFTQVNWIYGSEKLLVREVVSLIKSKVSPSSMNFSVLDMSKLSNAELFSVLHQHQLVTGDSGLTIVQNAHELEDLSFIKAWMQDSKAYFPNTTVCFISEDENFSAPSFLKPPKATLVRCSKLSSSDLVEWVKRNSPLSDKSARELLDHVAGSFADAYNMCYKLSAVLDSESSVTLPVEILVELIDETPSEFTDALISLDKVRAIRSIESLEQIEKYKVVGILDTRLSQLVKLQRVLKNKVTGKELSKIPGIPFPVVQDLLGVSKFYSSSRISACRKLLAVVDNYQFRGVYSGTLESLVALW